MPDHTWPLDLMPSGKRKNEAGDDLPYLRSSANVVHRILGFEIEVMRSSGDKRQSKQTEANWSEDSGAAALVGSANPTQPNRTTKPSRTATIRCLVTSNMVIVRRKIDASVK